MDRIAGHAANAAMLKRLGYKVAGPSALGAQIQTWNDWRSQCVKCKRPRVGTIKALVEDACPYCGHRSNAPSQ